MPVLDAGACEVGIESTIVDVDGDDWRMLRLGMIAESEIAAVAGKPALTMQVDIPKAPGQHLLHYSPTTPIQLFGSKASLLDFASKQKSCAALLIGSGKITQGKTFNLPDDPEIVAKKLYDTLHQMDALQADILLIEMPPNQAEWLAIRDRLMRASHKIN